MADFCDYKIKVRGKKNACYAFMSSTSCIVNPPHNIHLHCRNLKK